MVLGIWRGSLDVDEGSHGLTRSSSCLPACRVCACLCGRSEADILGHVDGLSCERARDEAMRLIEDEELK